jgi:hypothetical protein
LRFGSGRQSGIHRPSLGLDQQDIVPGIPQAC